ncbi:MAG: serine/threonine-protein kinase [Oculatellaceae cyanobacterium bins.114]|nr:serine/threonine-protein kinase [Oculatellaceae cyanobacterium bins.114]
MSVNSDLQWDELKLFEREAHVLKSLKHPRIPKYQDYFQVDQQNSSESLWWGLVQTYIPGITLKEALEQGHKFNEEELRRIAREILQILVFLHELSPLVLHRDIKPSNLILDQDHQIHLIDFGAVQSKVALPGTTFTVVGTVGYTPLEQFIGKAAPASDLYALGATLIHLLTGIAPAELPQDDLKIRFQDGISVNPAFIEWIERMTEPSVEKRFKSARQALASLDAKQDSDSKKTNSVSAIQTLRPKKSLKLSRPANSRFVLKKTATRLEIQPINPPKPNRIFFLGLGIGPIIIAFLYTLRWILGDSMYEMLLTFLIMMSVLFYCSLFLELLRIVFDNTTNRQHLYFDIQQNRFEIGRNVSSGSTSKRTKLDFWDAIPAIKYVMATQAVRYNDGRTVWTVIIRTDRSYSLKWSLTEAECMWLVQEIQDWLDSN